MDNDKSIELFIDISKNLGEINSNLKNMCETIAKHEVRIADLEKGNTGLNKDKIIKYLVIALLGTISILVTVTGSSAIFKQFFNL